MWITILIALLSYFGTKRATGGDKKKAAIGALIGGMGSAYAVSSTEWGANKATAFNSALGFTSDPLLQQQVAANTAAAVAGGTPTSTATTVPGTSVWDTVKSWAGSGAGYLAAGAAGAVAGSALPTWLPAAGIALAAYLILKD